MARAMELVDNGCHILICGSLGGGRSREGGNRRNLRCLLGDTQGEMLGGQLASQILSPKARSELKIYIRMVFNAMAYLRSDKNSS